MVTAAPAASVRPLCCALLRRIRMARLNSGLPRRHKMTENRFARIASFLQKAFVLNTNYQIWLHRGRWICEQAKRERDLRRMQDRVVGMRRSLVGGIFEKCLPRKTFACMFLGSLSRGERSCFLIAIIVSYDLDCLDLGGVLSTTTFIFATAFTCRLFGLFLQARC